MSKNSIAFSYYGGKSYHLKNLVPLFPPADHFVDVFGGSATVILNSGPNYKAKTYNDINEEVVNFFIQLRNNKKELIEKLKFTPYSRQELELACQPCSEKIEKARRFFVKATQSFSGNMLSANWARVTKSAHKINKAKGWSNKIKNLDIISEIFSDIQIESVDCLQLIQYCDHKNTFFYCDPPYVSDSRVSKNVYKYEMTNKNHVELCNLLNTVKGKVMISGYENKLYNQTLKNWFRIDFEPQSARSTVRKGNSRKRQESVWLNYNPETWEKQYNA